MLTKYLPTFGIAAALCLFVAAAAHYPGGTTESAGTVGYSWSHNFVSSLFAPRALNGAVNPGRNFAVLAMLSLCLSVGVMYWRISRKVRPHVHRKAIEIGGIGTVVYGFLAVTPMHDLMVSIGLLFSLTALCAMTHVLYVGRHWWFFGWGAICIALSLLSAVMYYGHVLYGYLPVVQKTGMLACVGWILVVHYSKIGKA